MIWNQYDVLITRSRRKSVSISADREGRIVVRAPFGFSDREIRKVLDDHREFTEKLIERRRAASQILPLTEEELLSLKKAAAAVIPERAAHYAPLIGVSYEKITIRAQKTRWGSCSGKGNLNFNCLLMLAPPEVLDAVVVHELCHLREMNHSPRFYREIARVFPDYPKHHDWLSKNGASLLERLPKE